MKRDTHDFKGFDGSTAPIKLPKGPNKLLMAGL